MGSIEQIVNGNFQNLGHLGVGRGERGSGRSRRDNGMQPKPGDRNIKWRQRPENADASVVQPNFFASFSQRGLLERLARFENATWQGYLAAMTSEVIRSKRE
jgi:hypothetical protein